MCKTIRLTGTKLYECFTTKSQRTKKENKLLRKELAQKKDKLRQNISDIELMTNLERSLASNNQRMSLPNISRAVKFEDSNLPPQVHFDNRGPESLSNIRGTQWHELEHVVEQPELDNVDEQLGAGGGVNWRDLGHLGQQAGHGRFTHHNQPK